MDEKEANIILRAFSDLTRLRILHLLRDGEVCVGDLVEILELPQPTVSRHLSHLRNAGLVHTRKDGLWRHYRIAKPRNLLHQRLSECLAGCFASIPTLQRDSERAAEVMVNGGCCPGRSTRDETTAISGGACCPAPESETGSASEAASAKEPTADGSCCEGGGTC